MIEKLDIRRIKTFSTRLAFIGSGILLGSSVIAVSDAPVYSKVV